MRIDYTVVVEPQELKKYQRFFKPEQLLVTPHSDKGLTVTRNWIWDYAEAQGFEKFWTFDDNIFDIWRLNKNLNIKVDSNAAVRVVEDFSDRFKNVGVTGMNYFMFVPRKQKIPPYTVNSRVYSNMLLKCNQKNPDGTPFRNNLYYNDDTDLNIRILKMGLCTIQFNIFQIHKAPTMTVKGGLTTNYETMESRKAVSQLIADAHPDIAKVVWKFNRWHHEVNYTRFKKNRLIKKTGLIIPDIVNEYGLILKEKQ